MEITIREYADKVGLNYNAALQRLRKYGKKIKAGLYEIDFRDDKLFEPQYPKGHTLYPEQVKGIVKLAEKGLPFWAIAEKVGCSDSTVRKYSRGHRAVRKYTRKGKQI